MFEKFIVNTDHASLSWLRNGSNPSGRVTRWLLHVFKYDFGVKNKKGPASTQADALSRLEIAGATC